MDGVAPDRSRFQFARAGERAFYTFTVSVPAIEDRGYTIEAVATAGGREYREGYDVIRHRDLETRYLYRPASVSVKGADVRIARGLKVGYVMGVGDDVPSGIAQLGVDVQLLGAQDLAAADLARFDAIVTGTRAYAVRDDLQDLQSPPAGLRQGRRQPHRPLQHAGGVRAVAVRAVSRRAAAQCRGSVRGGLPGRDPRAGPSRVHHAEQNHQGGLRPVGRAARIEILVHVGHRLHADALDVGPAARRRRREAGCTRDTGRGTTRTSRTRSTASCPYGVTGAYRLLANLLSLSAR